LEPGEYRFRFSRSDHNNIITTVRIPEEEGALLLKPPGPVEWQGRRSDALNLLKRTQNYPLDSPRIDDLMPDLRNASFESKKYRQQRDKLVADWSKAIARKKSSEADKLFREKEYKQAEKLYEEAIALLPETADADKEKSICRENQRRCNVLADFYSQSVSRKKTARRLKKSDFPDEVRRQADSYLNLRKRGSTMTDSAWEWLKAAIEQNVKPVSADE
ncbi:MAG: hypothetical protein ACOC6C_03495, partial [Verrucomicrobiota bacterium]